MFFRERKNKLEIECACKELELHQLYQKTGNEIYKILADGYYSLSRESKSRIFNKVVIEVEGETIKYNAN